MVFGALVKYQKQASSIESYPEIDPAQIGI